MNTLEAFHDPGPDRVLPRLSWQESLDVLDEQDVIIAIKHRRLALASMKRIMAKVDHHCNYINA